jgi:hypothetical protein
VPANEAKASRRRTPKTPPRLPSGVEGIVTFDLAQDARE